MFKSFKPVIGKIFIRGIFIASLIFTIISAIQIATADSHIEHSLQEWEMMKESMADSTQDDKDMTPTSVEKKDTASFDVWNYSDHSEPEWTEKVSAEKEKVEHIEQAIHVAIDQEKNVETEQNEQSEQSEQPEQIESNIIFNAEIEPGKVIGKMMIPTIDKELPIVHGTESKHLKKGVGHYIGTALPGEHQHSVLAGHRDTVFRGLENMQIGDRFEVETLAGLFTYEVEQLEIVDSDDRTIIVPRDEAILTLITCYPFYYVGNAPQRYIVTGRLVE